MVSLNCVKLLELVAPKGGMGILEEGDAPADTLVAFVYGTDWDDVVD